MLEPDNCRVSGHNSMEQFPPENNVNNDDVPKSNSRCINIQRVVRLSNVDIKCVIKQLPYKNALSGALLI